MNRPAPQWTFPTTHTRVCVIGPDESADAFDDHLNACLKNLSEDATVHDIKYRHNTIPDSDFTHETHYYSALVIYSERGES